MHIHTMPRNLKGKDFVVGDIHGCFTELEKLLNQIKFDERVDRLFCLGDLCDRGSESAKVLDWLTKNWVYAVRGNHEQELINYAAGKNLNSLEKMGATWWATMGKSTKAALIEQFSKLPIAIELHVESQKFGLIHAMCPHADWNVLKDLLKGTDKDLYAYSCLWDTSSVTNPFRVRNLDYLLVGHMSQKHAKIYENIVYLDTGSGYSHGYLTILDTSSMEFHSLPP